MNTKSSEIVENLCTFILAIWFLYFNSNRIEYFKELSCLFLLFILCVYYQSKNLKTYLFGRIVENRKQAGNGLCISACIIPLLILIQIQISQSHPIIQFILFKYYWILLTLSFLLILPQIIFHFLNNYFKINFLFIEAFSLLFILILSFYFNGNNNSQFLLSILFLCYYYLIEI